MSCVDYAINRLHGSDIDEYLLKLAFESNTNANYQSAWYNAVNQTTVDQGIRDKVIHRIVLPACQTRGGSTEYIDLRGASIKDLGSGVIEVNVPDTVTGGRKIISVAEVYLGSMNSATGMLGVGINDSPSCGQGTVSDMTQSLLDGLASQRSFPITYTNVHMTGHNSFAIFGLNSGVMSMSAKVTMEYDEGLSKITERHWEAFADLVELAVKVYIYRTCRRPVGEAVQRSGIPLDDIRDDVNEYRNAWEEYKRYLKEDWTRIMAWNDRIAVNNNVRMAVPRRI